MGELSIMKMYINHDYNQLPKSSDDVIPVQIYNRDAVIKKDGVAPRSDVATIGSPIINKIQRLGVPVSEEAMDFLTIALSVVAADTFIDRQATCDGWTRNIELYIPVNNSVQWNSIKPILTKALHFLSGDMWYLNFSTDGYLPPKPFVNSRHKLVNLNGLDSVSLFSGGLDSAIGVIDLLDEKYKPLLVSYSSKGDKIKQNSIASHLKGKHSRFEAFAHPISSNRKTEISMRTRSIIFLALAVIGCEAVKKTNNLRNINLFVPENGFISLNVPLTNRRIGSLSTKTTHPYFIGLIQDILDQIGFNISIKNPYQFKTKGEMVLSCRNLKLLKEIINDTVSCSHWKRKRQQCGYCVPCLIRQASLNTGKIKESIRYFYCGKNNIVQLVNDKKNERDDLFSLLRAIKLLESVNVKSWITKSGPLDYSLLPQYEDIFKRGLKEVEKLLIRENCFAY